MLKSGIRGRIGALTVIMGALLGALAAGVAPASAAPTTAAPHLIASGFGGTGITVLCFDRTGFTCAGGGYNGTSGQIGGNGWTSSQYWSFGSTAANGARHNCTTYAAYRLQSNGYRFPGWTDNANGWDTGAWNANPRVNVDQTPQVGSIAQWNGGSAGHVAYVEVVTPTYIETTSDNYLGGTDRLRITRTSAYMPDNFIHFKDVGTSGNLVGNGGFESGGWSRFGATTNMVVYANGQVAGESARSAIHYLATNTTGGSVYTDVAMSTPVPGTYCGNAWVRTQAGATGAGGAFVLWLLGGSYAEKGEARFTGLSNGPNWRQVSTCVTSTTPHTAMRVEFYPTPGGPTLEIDDVDVH